MQKSGRPGPVLVDITKDVTANKIEFTSKEPEEIKRYSDSITEDDLNTVADMIKVSEKPFILVGGWCCYFRSGQGSKRVCRIS